MHRKLLQAKLHRVRVTDVQLDYEGSLAVDQRLLDAADIREYEQLHIYNVNNGERFTTYAVSAASDSGSIAVLGAAARRVAKNDLLIICTYADFDEQEAAVHQPRRVYVDDQNQITGIDDGAGAAPKRLVV